MQRFDVEFTKDGAVFDESEVTALLDGATTTDLLVLVHGWNNDTAEARNLYDGLVSNVETLLSARGRPNAPETLRSLTGREFSVCQVFWPSKRFADEDLIPGGGAASATTENDEALLRTLDALAEDPKRLGGDDRPQERVDAVARAKTLVPDLGEDEEARGEFVRILRTLAGQDDTADDDGFHEFVTTDAEALFERMSEPVLAPGPQQESGGATGVGADGGAAGLGDLIEGVKAAARRLANLTTYYQMKARAGTVGSRGLAPLLMRCRENHPDLRIHLVGHSFGGRLVTAAADALPDNTDDVTLTLLQAAFSHNGLSGDFGRGQAGAFRDVLANHRVRGPVIITHTKNDKAVGIAYPLASRVAFQNAAALGDRNDPYGGMGRNGAQHTVEVDTETTALAGVGHDYRFAGAKVYNLLADSVIRDHGDVRGVEVAYAILCAAAAV